MKLQRNNQYIAIALYAFGVLVAAMLFWVFLQNAGNLLDNMKTILGYLQPVLFGVIIAFLLNPLLRLYDDKLLAHAFRRLKIPATVKRGLAIFLTYLTSLVILLTFAMIVLPQLISSLRILPSSMPNYIKMLTNFYNRILDHLNHMQLLNAGTEFEVLSNSLISKLISIAEGLMDRSTELIGNLFNLAVSTTTRVTAGLLHTVLGIIISIYLLYDREKLFAQIRKICTAFLPEHITALLYDIAQDTNRIFSRFIIGNVITSLIMGMLCFLGMKIFSLPLPVLISFIVFVTNLIPYFGPFIGAIPSALILLTINPLYALWFLILITLLQQFEGNIIAPKILGESTGLSPLWVIFAITLFGGLLGAVGMFIGVPLFAVIYTLVKRFLAYVLKRKGKSVDTRDYDSATNRLIR